MAWVKTTRITLAVTLLVAGATVAWLAAHPRVYAGHVGRLLTRNLLHGTGASFTCRDLSGNPFSRMVFHEVSVTRPADDGSFLYATADSLVIAYDFSRLMRREQRIEEIEVGGAAILMRRGRASDRVEPEEDSAPLKLPEVSIGRLRLTTLSFVLTAPDGTEEQEISEVTLETTVTAREEGGLAAEIHYLRGQWPTQDMSLRRLRADAVFNPPQISFHNAEVLLDSTIAAVDIDLDLGEKGVRPISMELRGEADRFLLSELMTVLGKGDEAPYLDLEGAASVVLQDGELLIEGRGSGMLEDAPVSASYFRGRIRDDVLLFEKVVGTYRSAVGEATGELALKTEPPRLTLVGDVSGADASDRWAIEDLGWPASDLAGRVRLQLDLGDSVSLDMLLENIHGEIATLPVDSARVDVSWSDADGLELRSARALSMGAVLHANGGIDANDQAEIFLRAETDLIAPWTDIIGLPIEGEGLAVAGVLRGPIDSMSVSAAGTVREARSGPLTVLESRASILIPKVERPEYLRLEFFSPELRAFGRPSGTVDLVLAQADSVSTIERLQITVPDSNIVATGTVVASADSTIRIGLDELTMKLGADEWRLEQASQLTIAPHEFTTPGLEFASDTGRFVLAGGASRAGDFDLRAWVVGGDLSLLERLGILEQISGRVDGTFLLAGSSRDPKMEISAEVIDLRVKDREVASGHVIAEVDGAAIDIQEINVVTKTGTADLGGQLVLPDAAWMELLRGGTEIVTQLWSDTRLELETESSDFSIAYWLDPFSDIDEWGRLNADLRLAGTAGSPEIDGHAAVTMLHAEPFLLPRLEGRVHADSLGVRLSEGRVDMGGPDILAEGLLPIVISLSRPSEYDAEQGIDFVVRTDGELDLATIPRVFPLLRRVEGKAELRLVAQGDPRQPSFSGHLRIREGTVEIEGWSEWLRELEIDSHFAGNRLVLDRIRAREGAKGQLDATGQVLFKGLLPDDVLIDARARRVLLSSVPFLRAVGTSDDLKLRLVRPSADASRAPKITGTVHVDKAIYSGDFAETAADQAALGATAAPLWLAEVRVRMQDQVRISNQSAELRVLGDIDFIRDQNGMRVRGRAEIPSGRVPLFNNDFTITEGSLDFSRRPLEPEVDIVAQTEVPIYDPSGNFGRELERINVHLTGTFARPQVAFESENGLDQQAILRLLAGFTGSTAGVTPGIGNVGLRAGLNFLERALSQQIRGVDTIDIETEEAGLDQMSSTRIAVGKYLSNNLYLRYSQGLSVTERDFFLEYQIGRRTLLTSELKRRLREKGAENEFNLDLKWRIRY